MGKDRQTDRQTGRQASRQAGSQPARHRQKITTKQTSRAYRCTHTHTDTAVGYLLMGEVKWVYRGAARP